MKMGVVALCHALALCENSRYGLDPTLKTCRSLAKEIGLPVKAAPEIQAALVQDGQTWRKRAQTVAWRALPLATRAYNKWAKAQGQALWRDVYRLRRKNGSGDAVVTVQSGPWGVTHETRKGEPYSNRCKYRKTNVYYTVSMPRSWRIEQIGGIPTAVPRGFNDRKAPVECRYLDRFTGVQLCWETCWVYRGFHSTEMPEEAVEQYAAAIRARWEQRKLRRADGGLLSVDLAVKSGVGCRMGCQAFAERLGARWGVPVVDVAPPDWALEQAQKMGESDSVARLQRYLQA